MTDPALQVGIGLTAAILVLREARAIIAERKGTSGKLNGAHLRALNEISKKLDPLAKMAAQVNTLYEWHAPDEEAGMEWKEKRSIRALSGEIGKLSDVIAELARRKCPLGNSEAEK